MILSSAVEAVTPSMMFNSAVVAVTPSMMLSSDVLAVSPSKILSSVVVTPDTATSPLESDVKARLAVRSPTPRTTALPPMPE